MAVTDRDWLLSSIIQHFLIIPSGCALPYGGSWADRTGVKGLLRELLPIGECEEVRQEGSEEMSTWQMRPLRPRLTIQTPGPGISSPKLLSPALVAPLLLRLKVLY